MNETPESFPPKVIAAVTCDFARTGIATRSRLNDLLAGQSVIHRVLHRLLQVQGLSEIILLTPADQLEKAQQLQSLNLERIHAVQLLPRPEATSARIAAARRWNLYAWRGGAGQATVFDEEYNPAAVAKACAEFHADHVLCVHSHGIFLDVEITAALIRHHLHKNLDMKITFTPSTPGLSGILLRADIAAEMGAENVTPGQLLAYDPALPAFDTLVRDACMQVDPALSKIPNRFCADTDRSWQIAEWLLRQGDFPSAAEMALAAARDIAPGIQNPGPVSEQPREVEIELTGRRLTAPPGSVPALVRESRGELDPAQWTRWLSRQQPWDDVLLTLGGDGDALLYPHLVAILTAARAVNFNAICVQTDLACPTIEPLLDAIDKNLVDVLSVTAYGHSAPVYAAVANGDLHAVVMQNLTRLAPIISARGGLPLVIPRLLKVRDTIPEMEPFFDLWVKQAGWAVLDGPTDRAGSIPFTAVVDMAPPKRKPCRRLWDRLLLRANGNAVACDQDIHDRLIVGNIESHSLQQMWFGAPMSALRQQHADAHWNQITPCSTCKEWHRP